MCFRPSPQDCLGKILADQPALAGWMLKRNLDFYSSMTPSFAETAVSLELSNAELLSEIHKALDSPEAQELDPIPSWRPEQLGQLIAFILERFHAGHRRQFPVLTHALSQLRSRVDHPALASLARVQDGLFQELESHMQKEEQILFPLFLSLERGESIARFHCGPLMPIRVMRMEHEDAALQLREIHLFLSALYEVRLSGEGQWLSEFNHFEQELKLHMHLENNLLFPFATQLVENCSAHP